MCENTNYFEDGGEDSFQEELEKALLESGAAAVGGDMNMNQIMKIPPSVLREAMQRGAQGKSMRMNVIVLGNN